MSKTILLPFGFENLKFEFVSSFVLRYSNFCPFPPLKLTAPGFG